MTREAAAAIVGDITESHGPRIGRFWLDIGSSAFALLVHSISRGPWTAVTLGFLGLALWFSIYCVVRVALAAAGLIPIDISIAECAVVSLSGFVLLAAALVSSNLLAGVAIGYRARVDGMNRCVPLALFWALAMIALPLADWLRVSVTWSCMLIYLLGLPLFYILPLLYGGALGGRISTRQRAAR
jgi:hypothetical protein